MPLPMYFITEWKYGPHLWEVVLVPFRKWNSFNNLRKDRTFGIDWVESMLNMLWTLELQMFLSYLHPHESITIPSEDQIIFNYLCTRQLWNMLYNVRIMLGKESTQSVPNFTHFLQWLKEFCFLKGACIISLNLTLLSARA